MSCAVTILTMHIMDKSAADGPDPKTIAACVRALGDLLRERPWAAALTMTDWLDSPEGREAIARAWKEER